MPSTQILRLERFLLNHLAAAMEGGDSASIETAREALRDFYSEVL